MSRAARRVPGLAAIVLTAAALAAGAPEGTLWVRVDPGASRVTFLLGATLHKVEGSAPLPAADLRLDPATGAMSGTITVPAASVTTGHARRDRKMHEQVLESARFPEIVLHPRRLRGAWDAATGGEVILEADLEIHGDRHAITVPLRITVDAGRAVARGELTIPYVAWGMEDPSAFLLRVAKEVLVQVTLAAEITPAPADTAADP